jgi:putative transposase
LNFPFAGARMLRDMLKLEGPEVGRKHVRTLMGKMGIAALYRKPRTSTAHPAHPIYSYLLKNLTIERPNHVWATDLTYSTPSQRRPPGWGWSCLSMSGMHDSTKSMLQ